MIKRKLYMILIAAMLCAMMLITGCGEKDASDGKNDASDNEIGSSDVNDGQSGNADDADSDSDASSEGESWQEVTDDVQFTDKWPENEYTAVISEPEKGTMQYIIDDSANGRFTAALKDITKAESAAYVELLQKDGYSLVQSVEEEDMVGVLLQKDDASLSIAYSEGILCISITLGD